MTEMIQPTGSGVGAFVNGIDLADSLSDNMVGELRNALGEHGVLFFRDQNISADTSSDQWRGLMGPTQINSQRADVVLLRRFVVPAT